MTTETQATHTPGPWEVRDTAHMGKIAIFAHGRWTADAVQTGDKNYSSARWAEAEANARLIAAAPDLLAALLTLVRADNVNYERDTMRYMGFFDAARDALEAATGQRY